ncbi:hypothetical protein ACFL35_18730 [Candidatus Riflebacteria bacterium]
MIEFPLIRQIRAPLDDKQLQPLDGRCRVVQFSEPLSIEEHKKLAIFISENKGISFRIFGHRGFPCNLNFLKYYPFLKDFQIDVHTLNDVSGLNYLTEELESLSITQTEPEKHSMKILEKFSGLKSLFIEGQSNDIAAIGSLLKLEELTLSSLELPDLSFLKTLRNLLSLEIKLGITRDLCSLPQIEQLRYLKISMVACPGNMAMLSEIKTLQYLFLQTLITVLYLPSFSPLKKLRRLYIENLKSLKDLQPAAHAPNLEELVVLGMTHLTPSDFKPFQKHKNLKRARICMGSLQKNREVKELLGLEDVKNLKNGFQFL